jgi:hypothetical protein
MQQYPDSEGHVQNVVRFTFQIYAHLLLLQHRDCPRLLHLRPLYQPYNRGCLRSQYSTSSSSVPTSTRCLVRFYLHMVDSMQQYPDSEGHVQNYLVRSLSLRPRLRFSCLHWPSISSKHGPRQFFLSIAASPKHFLFSPVLHPILNAIHFVFSFQHSVCYAQYRKS